MHAASPAAAGCGARRRRSRRPDGAGVKHVMLAERACRRGCRPPGPLPVRDGSRAPSQVSSTAFGFPGDDVIHVQDGVVRRERRHFFSGCESRPATVVPAGSSRSGRWRQRHRLSTPMTEVFDVNNLLSSGWRSQTPPGPPITPPLPRKRTDRGGVSEHKRLYRWMFIWCFLAPATVSAQSTVATPTNVRASIDPDTGFADVEWDWQRGGGPAASGFEVYVVDQATNLGWTASAGTPDARFWSFPQIKSHTRYGTAVRARTSPPERRLGVRGGV